MAANQTLKSVNPKQSEIQITEHLLKKNKEILFISHATPEDNPFTEWLYAQLKLAGYKCWCDLENLRGGERDFSDEIQKVISEDACKFLLIFSHNTFTKDFVKDEFDFAKSFAKKIKS